MYVVYIVDLLSCHDGKNEMLSHWVSEPFDHNYEYPSAQHEGKERERVKKKKEEKGLPFAIWLLAWDNINENFWFFFLLAALFMRYWFTIQYVYGLEYIKRVLNVSLSIGFFFLPSFSSSFFWM